MALTSKQDLILKELWSREPKGFLPLAGGTLTGDLILNDNVKVLFGDDSDSSIYYDGTDLVINPKEVGAGDVSVEGSVQVNSGGFQSNYDATRYINIEYKAAGAGLFSSNAFAFYTGGGSTANFTISDTVSAVINHWSRFYGVANLAYLDLYNPSTGYINLWNTRNFPTVFGTNNIERMRITGSGDIYLPIDNQKFYFGAGQDSSIYYDGTDLVINPKEVGAGAVKLNNTFVLDSYGTNNLFIGNSAGNKTLTGGFNAAFGPQALESITTGSNNFAMGFQALELLTTANNCTAIGVYAGNKITTAYDCTFIGSSAGKNCDAIATTLIGYNAGSGITSGRSNTAVGWNSLASCITGEYNVAVGQNAGSGSTGGTNVFLGVHTNSAAGSVGQSIGNVIIGYYAGFNLGGGDKNVFIGYNAGYNETGHNKLYIDNSNTSTPLIYGDFSSRYVRFGEDNTKIYLGTANDASIYYDGSDLIIDGGEVTPSDLIIDCGTNKTLELAEPVWDDLKAPATSAKTGGVKDPDFIKITDNGSGSTGVYTYAFDQSTEEELFFVMQFPHEMKTGSTISPHIHWMPTDTGTGDVRWGMEYTWVDIDGVFANTTILYVNDTAAGTAYTHHLAPFSDISGSSISGVSSMMMVRIFRDAGDAADTYGNDAALLEFDIHYQIDTMGSRQEAVK